MCIDPDVYTSQYSLSLLFPSFRGGSKDKMGGGAQWPAASSLGLKAPKGWGGPGWRRRNGVLKINQYFGLYDSLKHFLTFFIIYYDI